MGIIEAGIYTIKWVPDKKNNSGFFAQFVTAENEKINCYALRTRKKPEGTFEIKIANEIKTKFSNNINSIHYDKVLISRSMFESETKNLLERILDEECREIIKGKVDEHLNNHTVDFVPLLDITSIIEGKTLVDIFEKSEETGDKEDLAWSNLYQAFWGCACYAGLQKKEQSADADYKTVTKGNDDISGLVLEKQLDVYCIKGYLEEDEYYDTDKFPDCLYEWLGSENINVTTEGRWQVNIGDLVYLDATKCSLQRNEQNRCRIVANYGEIYYKNSVININAEKLDFHKPYLINLDDSYIKLQHNRLFTVEYKNINGDIYARNVKKELSREELFQLVGLFLRLYPKAAKAVLNNSGEQKLIYEALGRFLPLADLASQNKFVEYIRTTIATNRVLGIDNNKFFGIDAIGNASKDTKEESENYGATVEELGSNFYELDNDVKNLYISVSQGFVTVITGKQGDAKMAAIKDLVDNISGKGHFDTHSVYASRTWKDRDDFGQVVDELGYFSDDSEHYNGMKVDPCFISVINDSNSNIDEYFEEFLHISRNWYRTSDGSRVAGADRTIHKDLRFVLQTEDCRNGIMSMNALNLVNVVNIYDGEKIRRQIQSAKDNGNKYYFAFQPKSFDATPSFEEASLKDDNYEIYKGLLETINDCVKCEGAPVVIGSRRIEHAVSRYWVAAKHVMNEEELEEAGLVKLIPKKVVADVDLSSLLSVNADRVALDYALNQRVVSCITKATERLEIENATKLFEYLLTHQLFKCARNIADALAVGNVTLAGEKSDRFNEEYIIKKYQKQLEKVSADKFEYESADELVEHVCELVWNFRDKDSYTRNVIVNMLICYTQGFLTVFSGKPGGGKTSICRILAHSLGLTNVSYERNDSKLEYSKYKTFSDTRDELVDPARYLEISAERGWTSKRDFIGYYNPLTEQFDKSNALLFNTFLNLDGEARNKDKSGQLPCLIVLDEANLSPMEYYWADFMNLCEAWNENNSIDLGGGKVFKIPESLHFFATINNDHTTEILSPRLIDRANVIYLPDAKRKEIREELKGEIKPVTWEALKAVFGCAEDKNRFNDAEAQNEREIYENIKKTLEERFGVSISIRTDIEVSRYWTKAVELFDEEVHLSYAADSVKYDYDVDELLNIEMIEGKYKEICAGNDEVNSKGTVALDYVISQRILPKLTDISGDRAYDDMLQLLKLCMDNKLLKSAGIVIDMIKRGVRAAGYYNYFR